MNQSLVSFGQSIRKDFLGQWDTYSLEIKRPISVRGCLGADGGCLARKSILELQPLTPTCFRPITTVFCVCVAIEMIAPPFLLYSI